MKEFNGDGQDEQDKEKQRHIHAATHLVFMLLLVFILTICGPSLFILFFFHPCFELIYTRRSRNSRSPSA
jgi:hypothetical protein